MVFSTENSMDGFANFQFPILPCDEFFLVQPCIHAVIGQAGVESLHSVTVRVPQGDDIGVAEEDFQGSFGRGHKLWGCVHGTSETNVVI